MDDGSNMSIFNVTWSMITAAQPKVVVKVWQNETFATGMHGRSVVAMMHFSNDESGATSMEPLASLGSHDGPVSPEAITQVYNVSSLFITL
jgi:hypothetical protein